MVRTKLVVIALVVVLTCAACPQSPPPATGRDLYVRHCASCHGEAGDGDGAVAASLRRPPSDLRKISKRHGGFDEAYVMSIIDGRRLVAEHGSREMPVWGTVFEEQSRTSGYAGYTSLLHSRALTDHIRTLQTE